VHLAAICVIPLIARAASRDHRLVASFIRAHARNLMTDDSKTEEVALRLERPRVSDCFRFRLIEGFKDARARSRGSLTRPSSISKVERRWAHVCSRLRRHVSRPGECCLEHNSRCFVRNVEGARIHVARFADPNLLRLSVSFGSVAPTPVSRNLFRVPIAEWTLVSNFIISRVS